VPQIGLFTYRRFALISPELLTRLPAAFEPQAAKGVDCTIHFITSGPAYLVIKEGACTVSEGHPPRADLVVMISDENLVALLTGKMSPLTGLMTGKFKIEGSRALGARLKTFFNPAKLK